MGVGETCNGHFGRIVSWRRLGEKKLHFSVAQRVMLCLFFLRSVGFPIEAKIRVLSPGLECGIDEVHLIQLFNYGEGVA